MNITHNGTSLINENLYGTNFFSYGTIKPKTLVLYEKKTPSQRIDCVSTLILQEFKKFYYLRLKISLHLRLHEVHKS